MDNKGPTLGWVALSAVALLFVAGFVFRLKVVHAWHVPAGDGMDYYALSQELLAHGRYAYRGVPFPLSYARMPGYPLFLAYLVVGKAPMGLEPHLIRATLANVILDTGTAALVYLFLVRRSPLRAFIGALLVFICPTLLLLSCYGLGESLATFLTTLAVYLLWRARSGRLLLFATLAGLVLGLAMLTRADTVTLAPAVLLALLGARQPVRRRLLALALCGLVAGCVFAPWPLRNLARFGHPYAGSWYWRTRSGDPLPMGFIRWARTFASGQSGESFVDLRITVNGRLDPQNSSVVLPEMYDSPAEQALVAELFSHYNYQLLSPTVDGAFAALAAERERRAPLRTFVILPLRRMLKLWSPVPEPELPMKVSFLHLPERRAAFGWMNAVLFVFAAAGAARLLLRRRHATSVDQSDGRYLALMILGGVLLRSVLLSLIVAFGLTQRHLVEVFPLLITLAASV